MSKLVVVGTPIGNLEDISLRAVKKLLTVQAIVCEDTRRCGQLLTLLQERIISQFKSEFPPIQRHLISYRDQNHDRASQQILQLLQNGVEVILTTDSGMPTISDPGFKLVREAIRAGFEVDVIPGPTAATSALAISGLPTDKFVFLGFLPRQPGQILKMLNEYAQLPATLIIYEAPQRLHKLLETLAKEYSDREVVVTMELTKQYQRAWRGKPTELLDQIGKPVPKGEAVVLIAKE